MERIFEFNFGEVDKATGKPVIHEFHIDLDTMPAKGRILSLVPTYFEHKGWESDSPDATGK